MIHFQTSIRIFAAILLGSLIVTTPLTLLSQESQSGSRRVTDPSDTTDRRIRRYVEALIKQYDEDGDGILDAEELGSMRRPPARDADQNDDGLVDADELAAAIMKTRTGAFSERSRRASGRSAEESKTEPASNTPRTRTTRGTRTRSSTTGQTVDVTVHILQLDESVDTTELRKLAERINRNGERGMSQVGKEFGKERILSHDQFYANLRGGTTQKHQNGSLESRVVARATRRDGQTSYQTDSVDVGMSLEVFAESKPEGIVVQLDVQKSFIDRHKENSSQGGVIAQPIRQLRLNSEFLMQSGVPVAGVYSSVGRQWLVVTIAAVK